MVGFEIKESETVYADGTVVDSFEIDIFAVIGWEEVFMTAGLEICMLTGKKQRGTPGPGNSCEWMYGDAATGLFGIHALAGMNPMRWSGELTLNRAINELLKAWKRERHAIRPIILKVPANTLGQDLNFDSPRAAISHLMSLLPGRSRAVTTGAKGRPSVGNALWVADSPRNGARTNTETSRTYSNFTTST